ncbi:hypothetical protein [Alkaliphilus sp. B6464]|uniref:hypothetical protein n=1 Tax=Alkaliphilus sp. B6464 TaxID=2731219 RepID=UPI001BADED82|nr:hypothetical protein [Alkaliphilus sp. B6464]QUH21952.1 hypothetical protein HYG84_18775 [Alkaliphilus sp. B6464]
MYETHIIQCLLSILYTIKEHENVNKEIKVLNKLLRKTLRNRFLSEIEIKFLAELSNKYSYLLNILLENNHKNRIEKIATMNNLCYNYFKAESFILLLQKKDITHLIKQIDYINKDINEFNSNYDNENFLINIEKKYKSLINKFFQVIKNWLDLSSTKTFQEGLI